MSGAENTSKHRAHRIGLWAEILAAAWLLLKGYWPIARRYKTPQGEIDLICRSVSTLVYVEVKYRGAPEVGLLALQSRQLQRVRRAAEIFAQNHPHLAPLDQRVDLVVLTPKKPPIHVKNLV